MSKEGLRQHGQLRETTVAEEEIEPDREELLWPGKQGITDQLEPADLQRTLGRLTTAELEQRVAQVLEERADTSMQATFEQGLAGIEALRDHAVQLGFMKPEPDKQADNRVPAPVAAPSKKSDAPKQAAAPAATEPKQLKRPSKAEATEAKAPKDSKDGTEAKEAKEAKKTKESEEDTADDPKQPTNVRLALPIPTTTPDEVPGTLAIWPTQLAALQQLQWQVRQSRVQAEQLYEAAKTEGDPALVSQLDQKVSDANKQRGVPVGPASDARQRDRDLPAIAKRPPPGTKPTPVQAQAEKMRSLRAFVENEQRLERAVTDGTKYLESVRTLVRKQLEEGAQPATDRSEGAQRLGKSLKPATPSAKARPIEPASVREAIEPIAHTFAPVRPTVEAMAKTRRVPTIEPALERPREAKPVADETMVARPGRPAVEPAPAPAPLAQLSPWLVPLGRAVDTTVQLAPDTAGLLHPAFAPIWQPGQRPADPALATNATARSTEEKAPTEEAPPDLASQYEATKRAAAEAFAAQEAETAKLARAQATSAKQLHEQSLFGAISRVARDVIMGVDQRAVADALPGVRLQLQPALRKDGPLTRELDELVFQPRAIGKVSRADERSPLQKVDGALDPAHPLAAFEPAMREARKLPVARELGLDLDHDDAYEPLGEGPAPGPRPQGKGGGGGGGGGFAKPPKPPELPPPPQSANQAAINAYVETARRNREAARKQVGAQQLAKCTQVNVDANAVPAYTKVKNDLTLAALKAKAEQEKQAAAEKAAQEKQDGPVTIASLKEKLESQAAADKEELKNTFERKKIELAAKLDNKKATLDSESKKQVGNVKDQQAAKKAEAEAAWETQKKVLEKRRDDVIVEVRKTVETDRVRLEADRAKLDKIAEERKVDLEKTRDRDVATAKADGEKKATDLEKAGNALAADKRREGQTKAAQIRSAAEAKAAAATDDAEKSKIKNEADSQASAEQAKFDGIANDLEVKAKLDAKAARKDAEVKVGQLEDTTRSAIDEAKQTADKQVAAIDEKVNSLGPLADDKIKKAGDDLAKELADGEKKLAEKVKGTEEKIGKLEKEGQEGIAKIEGETEEDLQKEYDAQLKVIETRLESGRKELATATEKDVKRLEKVVDEACKAMDKSVGDAEKKFDTKIAEAEKKAQGVVVAQLQKIKAEADSALQAIDEAFAAAMKRLDDAVEATHRQIEELAQGKMLEIEVHTATLLNDLGEGSRLAAVKEQLGEYIKRGQKIPAGYGQSKPEPPSKEEKPEGEEANASETADKNKNKNGKPEDQQTPAVKPDPDAEAQAKLLDPANLSPEGIDAKVQQKLREGQQETSVGANDAAEQKLEGARKATAKGMQEFYDGKLGDLDKIASGDPKAIEKLAEEAAKQRKAEEAGKQAAEELKKTTEKKNWYGGKKDPDPKEILKTLEGADEAQIEAMREALKADGIELDAFVKQHMPSEGHLEEASARLAGDPEMGDILALKNSAGHELTGNQKMLIGATGVLGLAFVAYNGDKNLGADDERIREILLRRKDDPAFKEKFEKETGRPIGDFLARTGTDDLAKDLKLPEPQIDKRSTEEIKKEASGEAAKLLLDPKNSGKIRKDKVGPAAANLIDALGGLHLDGTRGDMVRDNLKDLSPEELAYIKAEYKAKTGRELDRDLEKSLSGAALVEAKATLRNDKTSATVYKLIGAEDGGLTPVTLDDKKLQDALKELKDPAERRAVLAEYKKRTGRDLNEVIAEKMTGNDRDLALAYAEGNTTKAQAIELDEATNGGFMNGLHKAIAERTGLPTEEFTRGMVNGVLGPVGIAAGAYQSITGEKLVIGGYEIQSGAIHKVDSDKIFELLEANPNAADRERLAALYKARTGQDLDAQMKHSLSGVGNDEKYKAYTALMDGRTADYYAHRMDDGVAGLDDPKAVHKQLEGKPEWQRKQIIEAYNKKHGDQLAFQTLCDGLSELDKEKLEKLATCKDDAKTGVVKLPDELVLRYAQDSVWNKTAKFIDENTKIFDKYPGLYAIPIVGTAAMQAKGASHFMRGWGVDNEAIKDVLKNKSKEEIEELKKQYPGLETDLKYCLSGRDAFEVQLMLDKGAPKTPQERMERQLALHDFDRGPGGAWFPSLGLHEYTNGLVDLISPSGKLYDEEAKLLREQLAVLQTGGQLTAEQQARLDVSLSLMNQAGTNFLAARDEMTGAIATAVGAVVGAVVTVLTGGVAGAVLAALASGLSTVAVKCAMMGQAYGTNEMGVDLAMMVVQMATAGIGGLVQAQSFLGQVLTGAIGNAASSFVQTAITSKDAHDLLGLLAQASKSGIVGFMSGAASSAATFALGQAMEKLSLKAFGNNIFGEDAALSAVFVKGLITGGGSSAASMFVEAIANPEMLSGNWDAIFAQMARTIGEGAITNAISETSETAGERRQQRRLEIAKQATDAANQKKAEGGTIDEQKQAFAEHMLKGVQEDVEAADRAADKQEQQAPTSDPDEIQEQLAKQPPPSDDAPPPDEPIVGLPIIDVGEAAKQIDNQAKGTPDADTADPMKAPTPLPDGDADKPPSQFGDETRSKTGKRTVSADTEQGPVSATVTGDQVILKFPEGMDAAQRQALARDALGRLGLSASDDQIAKISSGNDKAVIDQQLRVATPEEAAAAIKRELFDMDRVRDPDVPDDQLSGAEMEVRRAIAAGDENEPFGSDCTKMSTAWQNKLAEQGIFVPIINAESTGGVGHRYLVVGDLIIDPTIGQFHTGKVEGDHNQYEPFIGTYEQMRDRIQNAIDSGQMPGYASADEALAKEWGLLPGKDGKPFALHEGTKAFTGDSAVKPRTVDDARRLMDEQRALGIEPGQGLPKHLVDQVNAEAAAPAAPEPRGKRVGEFDDWGELNDAPAPAPTSGGDTEADAKWKRPGDDAAIGDDERAHRAAVDERVRQILEQDPTMSPRDAERRARNDVLYGIEDKTPGPVATATRQLGDALDSGNGEAAVRAIEGITDLGQRRALIQDLRRQHGNASLDQILGGLAPEHRAQIDKHLDSLRANPEAVAHAQSLLEAQQAPSEHFWNVYRDSSSSPEQIKAAYVEMVTSRQAAVDAITDAYGIDDSSLTQRPATERMGYGIERGHMAPSDKGTAFDPTIEDIRRAVAVDGMAEAMPTGNVLMRNGGEGLFVDPATGKPRSAALVAAALGHEAEVHIEQLREGRYAKSPRPGEHDVGTAINEAEAYSYMLREADRFGLSSADRDWVQSRLDDQLRYLAKHDPAAHERAAAGDYSLGDLPAEHQPQVPWSRYGGEGGSSDGHGKRIGDHDGDPRIAEQMARGHAGIEVHSHFMGNVEPSRFRDVIEQSGLAPRRLPNPDGQNASERVGDLSGWEPALREIAAMQHLAHQYKQGADGGFEIDPITNLPVVAQRGVSGDAIRVAQAALVTVERIKAAYEHPNMSADERLELRQWADETVRSAVDKALRASDETDFNSSYEIRDELVKKFYGASERADVLRKAGLPADASLGEARDAYHDHFKDRPAVRERIDAAVAAQRELDAIAARKQMDPTFQPEPGTEARLRKEANAIVEQLAFDAYAKDTILRLAEDKLDYTEQSNSVNKLGQRFDEQQIAVLKQQLVDAHPHLAAQIRAIEIKHLAMINTSHFGLRDETHAHARQSDIPEYMRKRSTDKAFQDELKRALAQLSRSDVVGIDIAGAEHYGVDDVGKARLVALYEGLAAVARDRKQPVVLRPHVGEGANDMQGGKHFMRDGDRQIVDGLPSHYLRAKDNLDAMLDAFESVAGADGKLPPEVIVRFGHATHATPEQAERMVRLGIIAEVNLTSNVETGSVGPRPVDGVDRQRTADTAFPPHEPDPLLRGGDLDDHALPRLIASGVQTILSTDAHAVMSTNMADQYRRAAQLIERVRANDLPVDMTADRARQMGIEVPDGQRVVAVSYAQMDAAMQQRFDDAMRKLYEDANRYYDARPQTGHST